MEPLIVAVAVPFVPRGGFSVERSCAYADALIRDVEAAAPEMGAYEVQAVRVAGPCPQLLEAADLARVLDVLRSRLNTAPACEVSVEVMPGRLTSEALAAYREAGVTALVLDVETTQGREAKLLDRPCDVGDSLATVLMLQGEGFESYGARVAWGLPAQTPDSFRRTLNDVFFMEPDFVFAGPGRVAGAAEPTPSDSDRVAMEAHMRRFLRGYGYEPQVAGLYAKAGRGLRFDHLACEGVATLGLGLGSETCYEGFLYRTTSDLERYLAHAGDLEETCEIAGTLEPADLDRRRVAGLLRRAEGLGATEAPSFLLSPLDRMTAAGTLELAGGRYRMTPRALALGIEPVDLW